MCSRILDCLISHKTGKSKHARLLLHSLKLQIAYHRLNERHPTRHDDLMVLDACIQRFEYTCELSVKYMRRQLEALVDPLPALQMYLIRDDQSQS
jgi:Nucleotidyltransferase substrate binding protein like